MSRSCSCDLLSSAVDRDTEVVSSMHGQIFSCTLMAVWATLCLQRELGFAPFMHCFDTKRTRLFSCRRFNVAFRFATTNISLLIRICFYLLFPYAVYALTCTCITLQTARTVSVPFVTQWTFFPATSLLCLVMATALLVQHQKITGSLRSTRAKGRMLRSPAWQLPYAITHIRVW